MMKKAIKKSGNIVKAYRLGDNNPITEKLTKEGKIVQINENTFELFSYEAINGHGEIALKGDWYKIDSTGAPYPNSKEFFETNHRHIQGDEYEQIPKPVDTWNLKRDGICPEIEFLVKNKKLIIDESSIEKYFSAQLWGTLLSARSDAIVIFYKIEKDRNDNIVDINFNFVENAEFYKTYDLL